MASLRETAVRRLALGRPTIVVEVAQALGSAPREAGTRMLVGAEQVAGTVGGGHLEWKAIANARAMLERGARGPHSEHYPLGPALGQCCGGAVTLNYALLDATALACWPEPRALFELQLYGAGHVGRAIVNALAPLDVRVEWIDERENQFVEFDEFAELGAPPPRTARIHSLCVDSPEAEVRNAPPGAFYLVLTHRHDLDLRIAQAILRRGDFGYFGLIGSKTKRQRFVHRFEQLGLAANAIARMTCPIGVPGIEGKEPATIAAAVVAQLLQVSAASVHATPERSSAEAV